MLLSNEIGFYGLGCGYWPGENHIFLGTHLVRSSALTRDMHIMQGRFYHHHLSLSRYITFFGLNPY